jgi:hypothetical protein
MFVLTKASPALVDELGAVEPSYYLHSLNHWLSEEESSKALLEN